MCMCVCVCVRVSDFWEFLTEKGGIPTLPTRSMATRGDVRALHLPVTLCTGLPSIYFVCAHAPDTESSRPPAADES
jgi:hypothetical protein